MSTYMSDGKYFRRHRKKRVTTLEHTSFASPLDSILFRDSTHSSHFAEPLGSTAGLLFLPSHSTRLWRPDIRSPRLSLFYLRFLSFRVFFPLSFANIVLVQPLVSFQVVVAAFSLFPRPSSFVRSSFSTLLSASTPPACFSFVHPIL